VLDPLPARVGNGAPTGPCTLRGRDHTMVMIKGWAHKRPDMAANAPNRRSCPRSDVRADASAALPAIATPAVGGR
jgi:hypothetical protein